MNEYFEKCSIYLSNSVSTWMPIAIKSMEQITKADRNACHALCRTERSELMSHRR